MNDRYLSRGKRKDNGEWVTGYYKCGEKAMIYPFDYSLYYNTRDYLTEAFYIDPDTKGQCTGLRDKNGTLIFEGDIVKLCETNPILFIVSIEMKKYGWACVFRYVDDGEIDTAAFLDKCEIIGNIHDNPELLKAKVTP